MEQISNDKGECQKESLSTESSLFRDKAKGCIFGALIGDATGAPLEFDRSLNKTKIENALKMKGGGFIKIGPGQITDDGELTLCLFQGLHESKGKLNPDHICLYYGKWLGSPPFDIGNTTRKGLGPARAKSGPISKNCHLASETKNKTSVSNGSTMRMSPIAVWVSKLPIKDLKKAITIDTKHTHCHNQVIDCNITFALAIKELLKGVPSKEAYDYAIDFGKNSSIKDWIDEMENGNFQNPKIKIGWVKIAFQIAFHFLRQELGFLESLKQVVSYGGDTDTNACITGMLLGARDGLSGLPSESLKKVMKWDNFKGHKRPKFLIPKYVLTEKKLEEFLDNVPEKLSIDMNKA